MKQLWTNISASFDTFSTGFSARKLVAAHLMLLLTLLDLNYCQQHPMPAYESVISIHIIGAFLCLGIITLEQIIRSKEKFNTHETL